MIDAATFANSYNAFWNAYTPTCEHFVRRLNLAYVERFAPPMIETGTSNRRALIAEFAFAAFAIESYHQRVGSHAPPKEQLRELALLDARQRLRPYEGRGLDLDKGFDSDEETEARQIYRRLVDFFQGNVSRIIARPRFYGCGFIDSSEGDIIQDATLFEVKTVDRTFRSNDVRQAVTYAALNFASKQFTLDRIGLFNPRRGIYCDLKLDLVCSEISGRPAQQILELIVENISNSGISR